MPCVMRAFLPSAAERSRMWKACMAFAWRGQFLEYSYSAARVIVVCNDVRSFRITAQGGSRETLMIMVFKPHSPKRTILIRALADG
jgi:hypothetical protein